MGSADGRRRTSTVLGGHGRSLSAGAGPCPGAEPGSGKVPARGAAAGPGDAGLWGAESSTQSPSRPRTARPRPPARPRRSRALLWAFTRRLPTMRRCLRKFLGAEAPGAGEGREGGAPSHALPSPLLAGHRPNIAPCREGCPPGAPSSPTGKSHPVPLLLRLLPGSPFAASTKAR